MANICDNELYIYCAEEDVDIVCKYMDDTFPNTSCALADKNGDESEIHYYFDSRWSFPEKEMNELITLLTKPDQFTGTCLSVEWGCLYCAFHTGDGDGWYYEG